MSFWLPDFTEIADSQMIISYSMSREWIHNHNFNVIHRNLKETK